MMERHFVTSLQELESHIMLMGSNVQMAIEAASQGLQGGNRAKLADVYDFEETINQQHMAIDEACVKHLALQHPLAGDLRLVISIIKVNADLERMADHAVNIAHNAEKYVEGVSLKPLEDLPVMFNEVKKMVRDCLDAFLKRDETMAREVLKRDDVVDALKAKIFKDVIPLMRAKPDMIESGLSLIFISRNLEKIADHATNVAEDLIFIVTGKDVRHAPKSDIP